MRKIPTLFIRDEKTHRVLPELNPACQWVEQGEGIATRKFDGSACWVKGDQLFKRYDAKKGKTPPPDFIPAQAEADPNTGHFPGWVPVTSLPEDKFHREAWEAAGMDLPDWTYELIGPKVNGGKERAIVNHVLIRHGISVLLDCPRDFAGLRAFLTAEDYLEGIVWWRDLADPDCDMAKLKRRDLGLKWGGR